MLMQPRHHYQLLNPSDASGSPSSTFLAPTFPQFSDQDSMQNNTFAFTDPFSSQATTFHSQSDMVSQGQGYSQAHDWQIFGGSDSRLSQTSQPATQSPRKRFRPNDRNFSNDAQKSPVNFAHHLPTPSNTPTRPAFLDANLHHPRALSSALQMNPNIDQQQHYEDYPGYAHSSVSSYGHDSPATPHTSNGDEQGEMMDVFAMDDYSLFGAELPHVPNLERTLSDAYADELYPTYTSHPMKYIPTNPSLLSPYSRNSIGDRIQAANMAHQARSSSPHERRPSPFRNGSPFAAPSVELQNRIGSVAGLQQQQQQQQQQQRRETINHTYQQSRQTPNTSEPATISPKDAVLEYHETPEDIEAPLDQTDSVHPRRSYYNWSNDNFFQPPSLPASTSSDMPLYMKNTLPSTGSHHGSFPEHPELPAHLLSMETSASASDVDNAEFDTLTGKPIGTLANRGAYACTATGCTQRFESPGKLQKHRREDHPTGKPRLSPKNPILPEASGDSDPTNSDQPNSESEDRIGSDMTSAEITARNAWTGPHTCLRINPSTGKPCNSIFSRPYDLTRHEDTIHNHDKKKVRCQYCTEEKVFSRGDALTRHMRVVHMIDLSKRRRHQS